MTDTRGEAMMLKLYIKYPLWGEVDPVDDPWNMIYKSYYLIVHLVGWLVESCEGRSVNPLVTYRLL